MGGQGGVAPLTGNFNGTGAATLQLSMSSLFKVPFSKPTAEWPLDTEIKEKAQKPSLRGPEQHQTQESAQRRCLRGYLESAQLRQRQGENDRVKLRHRRRAGVREQLWGWKAGFSLLNKSPRPQARLQLHCTGGAAERIPASLRRSQEQCWQARGDVYQKDQRCCLWPKGRPSSFSFFFLLLNW